MTRMWYLVNFFTSLRDLNSEFSFSLTSCHTMVKEPSLSYHSPIAGKRIIGFMPFTRVLAPCEMQTDLSWIWTQVTMSIFYDKNPLHHECLTQMWMCVCMYVKKYIYLYIHVDDDIPIAKHIIWFSMFFLFSYSIRFYWKLTCKHHTNKYHSKISKPHPERKALAEKFCCGKTLSLPIKLGVSTTKMFSYGSSFWVRFLNDSSMYT